MTKLAITMICTFLLFATGVLGVTYGLHTSGYTSDAIQFCGFILAFLSGISFCFSSGAFMAEILGGDL